jgi:hypothetical protein
MVRMWEATDDNVTIPVFGVPYGGKRKTYYINLHIRRVIFLKCCFLEKRGLLIFGSLRINIKKMIIRSSNC